LPDIKFLSRKNKNANLQKNLNLQLDSHIIPEVATKLQKEDFSFLVVPQPKSYVETLVSPTIPVIPIRKEQLFADKGKNIKYGKREYSLIPKEYLTRILDRPQEKFDK